MKKKILIAVIIIILLVCATVLLILYAKPVETDCGTSDIYTEEEIQTAIDIVETKFKDFKGCKLFSLSYAGDEDSLKEFDYDENYDQAIVINSKFLSPLIQKGGWNAHEIYTWHFILMRKDNGIWQLLTWGYA